MTRHATYQHLKRWLNATAHDGMRLPLYIIMVCLLSTVPGCRIEPPLKLPTNKGDIVIKFGDIITDLRLIWDIDAEWEALWYYGWDDEDIKQFGEIEYPAPTNYEGRFYYMGDDKDNDKYINLDRMTIFAQSFHRRFDYGYHNILLWSNIDSPDGTQTLIINENDDVEIRAYTSRSRLGYSLPPSRSRSVYNAPEIFYGGREEKFYVSSNFEDYDYYDPELDLWVKESRTILTPLVYMYALQVIVYNNNGRIVGTADDSSVDNLADGVNVRTGHTSNDPAVIAFPMRFKKGRQTPKGYADIFGTKLTTFGLCDMDPWTPSRGAQYEGSRSDLTNQLTMCLYFSNASDSVYVYDLTDQMQRQAHGGILTVEIDADTLKLPQSGTHSTSTMFDPTIIVPDSVTQEIPL